MKKLVLLASAGLLGCSAILDARRAQEELAPASRDDYVAGPSERLELGDRSLSELVDFAMTNRPSIVKARLAVEDARLALRQLAADAPLISETPWTSPALSFILDYGETSESAHLDELSAKTYGSASGSLTLSIPIWDFGRHDAKTKAQCERVLAAELELVDAGYAAFYDVSGSYFTLLEKGALLEVAFTNEAMYAEHLVRAEKRFAAGEVKKIDVQRARLDVAQAKEATVTAENDLETAGAEFLRSLGLDASRGVRREVIDFPGNALTFAMRGFPDTDYSVKEAYTLAVTNAPAMRLARARLRGAIHDVDSAIRDMYPDLDATVSLNWADPLWSWHWSVNALQSVFEGLKKDVAVERAVVAMKQTAADLDATEQELSVSLEKAVASRDSARKARETALESLREAKSNLELARSQYEVGDIPRIEFTSAVADYVKAMGSGISAFYQGQRAEAAIFSLIGVYPVYEEKKLTEEPK